MPELTMIQALNLALKQEMEKDDRVMPQLWVATAHMREKHSSHPSPILPFAVAKVFSARGRTRAAPSVRSVAR